MNDTKLDSKSGEEAETGQTGGETKANRVGEGAKVNQTGEETVRTKGGSERKTGKAEETFGFMMLLTFVGGYSNGYSYFTRGGAFVSFHTGNITKLGIAAATGDWFMFLACIAPVCGGLTGAVFAQLIKAHASRISVLFWQKTALIAELTAFLIAGLLPASVPDSFVNFFLSVILMFQLSNFRKYEGNVHNSTIETGNLRTLGQYCGDFLLKKNLESAKKVATYFVLVSSFPLGTLIGSLLSLWAGRYAIWVCCIPLAVLTFGRLPKIKYDLDSAKQGCQLR